MELKNVINEQEYAEVVTDLKARLSELRVKYGDSEELDQMYIEKYSKKNK